VIKTQQKKYKFEAAWPLDIKKKVVPIQNKFCFQLTLTNIRGGSMFLEKVDFRPDPQF
jgi:hypothetical protein